MCQITEDLKLRVWNKGREVEGYNSASIRKDACGAWIKYDDFRNRESIYGSAFPAASEPLFGITKINHRPSNLNYWHFTLDTYPATREGYIEEPRDNSEKNLLKKVGKQLLRYSFRRYEEVTIPVVKETLWNK